MVQETGQKALMKSDIESIGVETYIFIQHIVDSALFQPQL